MIEKAAKKWTFWGILAIGLVAPLLHFLYGWTGSLRFVGAFFPVNESVWEHTKLTLWTTALWWACWYIFYGAKRGVNAGKWFSGALTALCVTPLVIITVFYVKKDAFGVDSLFIDILSMYIGLSLAQFAGHHVYRFGRCGKVCGIISAALIVLVLAAYALFTYATPHLPMFMDTNTGLYGI